MSLGSMYALQGLTSGLNQGLDDLQKTKERQQRFQLEKERDTRAQETHDLQQKVGANQLEESDMKLKHSHFVNDLDPALGRFIMSDGADYQPLQDAYNKHAVDGHQMAMSYDQGSKTYTMDFGDGNVRKGLDAQHVAGLASLMRDPSKFAELQIDQEKYTRRKKAEVDATREIEGVKDEFATKRDERKATSARELEGTKHSNRMAEAGVVKPTITAADDGTMAVVGPDGVKPIAGTGPKAGGLTFHNGKNGGGTPKEIAAIDAFAAKLPPVAGETDDQRWLRAAAQRARYMGKNNPDAAIRSFEANLRTKILGGDPNILTNPKAQKAAEAFIQSQVDAFRKQYGGGPEGATAGPGAAPDAKDPLGLFGGASEDDE